MLEVTGWVLGHLGTDLPRPCSTAALCPPGLASPLKAGTHQVGLLTSPRVTEPTGSFQPGQAPSAPRPQPLRWQNGSWVAWAVDCVSLGPRLLIAGKRTQPVHWPQVPRRRCQAPCLAKRHSEGTFPGP